MKKLNILLFFALGVLTTIQGQTKTITVVCTWESSHEVEVPADYVPTGGLDAEWIEDATAHIAELTDWEVRGA